MSLFGEGAVISRVGLLWKWVQAPFLSVHTLPCDAIFILWHSKKTLTDVSTHSRTSQPLELWAEQISVHYKWPNLTFCHSSTKQTGKVTKYSQGWPQLESKAVRRDEGLHMMMKGTFTGKIKQSYICRHLIAEDPNMWSKHSRTEGRISNIVIVEDFNMQLPIIIGTDRRSTRTQRTEQHSDQLDLIPMRRTRPLKPQNTHFSSTHGALSRMDPVWLLAKAVGRCPHLGTLHVGD